MGKFQKLITSVAPAVVVLAASGLALAQGGGGGPSALPDIEFPIEPSSIVTKVMLAAGIVLGLGLAAVIGIRLVKGLAKRLGGAGK